MHVVVLLQPRKEMHTGEVHIVASVFTNREAPNDDVCTNLTGHVYPSERLRFQVILARIPTRYRRLRMTPG
jgi:hypothetical protein